MATKLPWNLRFSAKVCCQVNSFTSRVEFLSEVPGMDGDIHLLMSALTGELSCKTFPFAAASFRIGRTAGWIKCDFQGVISINCIGIK